MDTIYRKDEEARRLKVMQDLSEQHFQLHRDKLQQRYREILQDAIKDGYIEVSGHGSNASNALLAYQHWCGAYNRPYIAVTPGINKFRACVELSLESLSPFGSINVECVDLDLEDERFRLLMLLCNEYQFSNYHIKLRAVPKEHVKEVIRELQAWYERSQKVEKKGK